MSSDFRKIYPSFGQSSASGSNPSQTTSESRRSRGDKETPAETSASSPTRRRVLESVTRNACVKCQKARTKCDGKQPCSRCEARVETSECIYKIHIKHAKEELVKQIEQLRAKEHVTERILQALSANEKVSEILERLQSGETYDSIVELLAQSPVVEFEIPSPKEFRYSTHEPPHHEMGGDGASKRFWTIVTSDTAILDLQSGSSSKQDPSPA